MSDATARLAITAASADVRRALRPVEWMVLEDVALYARVDGTGVLVAATSARRIVEHLGFTPGAAARALAGLRTAGLITHHRLAGPAGRFGLSVHSLLAPPGLEVIDASMVEDSGAPDGVVPRLGSPHVEPPRVVDRHVVATKPVGERPSVSAVADSAGRRGAHAVGGCSAAELEAGHDPVAARRHRVGRSPRTARPSRPESQVDQLSILDLADDGDPHAVARAALPRSRALSPDQRRSPGRDDRVQRPDAPDA